MKSRIPISLAMLAVGASLLIASALVSQGARGSISKAREGGTLKIGFANDIFGTVDPAVTGPQLRATCGSLLRPSDASPVRIVPEIATGYRVSNGGRRFTFILRRSFRLSSGERVKARNFKVALERILDPRLKELSREAPLFQDIVGADAIVNGTRPTLSGVRAFGYKLVIRLVHAHPDLPLRMSLVCAVPRNLPVDPEGVRGPVASAGPYFVSRYVRGEELVLSRNKHYGGGRRVHLDRISFRFDLPGNRLIPMVETGELDVTACCFPYSWAPSQSTMASLKKRYGLNKSRLWVRPQLWVSYLAFNMRGGLFHKNLELRRAVNYALDRDRIHEAFGSSFLNTPTDRYVPPGIPGRMKGHLYPPHKPNQATALRLAKGHTRTGKATLLWQGRNGEPIPAAAAVIKSNLAGIGIHLAVKLAPLTEYTATMRDDSSGWDIGQTGWSYDYADPYAGINLLFHRREVGNHPENGNLSGIDVPPRYDKLMNKAAALPLGPRRWRAYARLERELMTEVAPIAVFRIVNAFTFVSTRVGCLAFTPYLNPATACLKR